MLDDSPAGEHANRSLGHDSQLYQLSLVDLFFSLGLQHCQRARTDERRTTRQSASARDSPAHDNVYAGRREHPAALLAEELQSTLHPCLEVVGPLVRGRVDLDLPVLRDVERARGELLRVDVGEPHLRLLRALVHAHRDEHVGRHGHGEDLVEGVVNVLQSGAALLAGGEDLSGWNGSRVAYLADDVDSPRASGDKLRLLPVLGLEGCKQPLPSCRLRLDRVLRVYVV